MGYIRCVEVDDQKFFKEDIEKMDKEQVKMLCSFLGKESDLRFVQSHCNESFSYLIDNIILNSF